LRSQRFCERKSLKASSPVQYHHEKSGGNSQSGLGTYKSSGKQPTAVNNEWKCDLSTHAHKVDEGIELLTSKTGRVR
jgi:hypothetical protein